MKLQATSLALLTAIAALQLGCGGASGNSTPTSTTPPTTPSTTVPDSGTLYAMDDSVQYKLKNVSSGMILGISGQSQVAGTAVVQGSDSGGGDQLWHVLPMGSNEYNIEDLLTHQVMGISNASLVANAAALQWADNGTADHLWEFYLLKDGNYLIKNVNSGLYLEDEASGTTASAVIDQNARATTGTGCTCQEWTVTSTGTTPYPAPLTVSGSGIYVHDPYMLKDQGGVYWLYGTHNTLASSSDMSTFVTRGSDISPDFSWWKTVNTTGTNGLSDIWAPSVMFQNGVYYQYYSMPLYSPPGDSSAHSGAQAVIALGTSTNPNGPWTDDGKIIESYGTTTGSTTAFNAIDPAPFLDGSGNWWMVFGSWEDGIHVLQLDPASGLRLASNSTIYNVAQRGLPSAGEEGAFIFPYNGWFYYFASTNVCCNGVNSTYRIIVGRSQSATGPYLDRGGIDLMNGGGTILLGSHGTIFGPGGQSVFLDGTQPTLVYHYYDGANNGTPTVGINRLVFDSSGWPSIQ